MAVNKKLSVVVVTYNRCDQLLVTLDHYHKSIALIEYLIVVNNASTDDTSVNLRELADKWLGKLMVINLRKNVGGAGGFHEGVKKAVDVGSDWVFISDDDAVPEKDCLKKLLAHADNASDVYGAVAVSKGSERKELCWPVKSSKYLEQCGSIKAKRYYDELSEIEYPGMIPFLGFLVSAASVRVVGYPNKEYFISGDDVEYGIRLQALGAQLIQVKAAVMIHPPIPRKVFNILGREFNVLIMPPWRRYLDVRNRVWNSRLEEGVSGAVSVALSYCVHLPLILLSQGEKFRQIVACSKGLLVGLFRSSPSHSREGLLKNKS